MEQRSDRFTAIEDQYQGYEVYDRNGDKIGKVDDMFVDENDQPEYIGVKMGFLGTRSTLIPWEVASVDENDHRIEVSVDKATAKEGPSFDDDQDITSDYEEQVYSHYGLQRAQTDGERGGYGEYYGDDDEAGKVGPGMRDGDTESGEFRGHSADDEGVNQSRGSDLEDEDELRVQRSEEELTAGTREREAGRLNVRKRVRTDREQMRVPTRREEVNVERVPVNDREAAPGEIGEDEVSMPVVEDEVVVGKQAVVKEDIRVRKDVVNEDQVVEEDVRKEEVDIDDQTTGRGERSGDTARRDNDDLDDETRRRDR